MEFRLPDVGEGIDAAEIVEWHVAVGDAVVEDQPLAEIQTDKAIVSIPCPATGTVAELRAQAGDTVAVGEIIAVFQSARATAKRAEASSEGPVRSDAAAVPTGSVDGADAAPRAHAASPQHGAREASSRPLASPAVRKLARDSGVDLRALVPGSGPAGRIVRSDVEAARDRDRDRCAPPPSAPARARADEVLPLRGTRRAIARTLTHAWQTVPHVFDHREVDATRLLAARRRLKAAALGAGDDALAQALTIVPLVVKMCAAVLRRHPYVNGSLDLEREQIVLHGGVHVGIATAAPDGLVVPVLRDADRKSVHEIAREAAALGRLARERRLAPEQLRGATFTVNNYGALGIRLGTPIVVPPQVANLGIGRLDDQAVVRDNEIVVRPIIPVACAGDHRLLDGDAIAAFLGDVVAFMEDPTLLLGDMC